MAPHPAIYPPPGPRLAPQSALPQNTNQVFTFNNQDNMKEASLLNLPNDVILGHAAGSSKPGPVTVRVFPRPHIVGTGSMVAVSAAISLADGLPESKYNRLPCKQVQMGK